MKNKFLYVLGFAIVAAVSSLTFDRCKNQIEQLPDPVFEKAMVMELDSSSFAANQKGFVQKRLVTGHLATNPDYNYAKNEKVLLSVMNRAINISIDSITRDVILNGLIANGVDIKNIIYADGYGSSDTKTIEFFFAFVGALPTDRIDNWVQNSHNRNFAGYSGNDMVVVPQFKYINKDTLKNTIIELGRNFEVKSFLVKPWVLPELSFAILSRSPKDGILADMRNIPNSVRLVPYFKELNWSRIWYQENSVQKTVVRPSAGW